MSSPQPLLTTRTTHPLQPPSTATGTTMNHPQPKFIIESEEAESMAKSKGLTVPQLLPSLIKSAQTLARPPISNFAVGVVGLVSDGRIFLGANVEFPGLPLHHTIHGEQFFITNLAANAGGSKLLYIAVSATPCGHCRQFFQELRGINETQIVITNQPVINPDYKPFSSILPHAFGPLDLLDQETPLILEKHSNQLSIKGENLIAGNGNKLNFIPGYEKILTSEGLEAARGSHEPNGENNLISGNGGAVNLITGYEENLTTKALKVAQGLHAPYSQLFSQLLLFKDGNLIAGNGNTVTLLTGYEESLTKAALEAARGSHAPYSGCPSGVALMDCEGKMYKGSYMESAAYNPSMMPVQAALVAYMVAGGGGYERIVAAGGGGEGRRGGETGGYGEVNDEIPFATMCR